MFYTKLKFAKLTNIVSWYFFLNKEIFTKAYLSKAELTLLVLLRPLVADLFEEPMNFVSYHM